MFPSFTPLQWTLAALGAFCVGFSKSGFSGLGLLTVIIMARLFPPLESTGVLLPLLICGDALSVLVFHQHARWKHIWRMLPPTLAGIALGFFAMQKIPEAAFGPVIGGIVLLMVLLHSLRKQATDAFSHIPHSRTFAWIMGIWAGVATMLANAAGPVMALYFLAIDVPKFEFLGTSAWFFLLVNLLKVPFSLHLGLITSKTLLFNLVLMPMVGVGIFAGQRLIRIVPQRLFTKLLLIFASIAALRLIGVF